MNGILIPSDERVPLTLCTETSIDDGSFSTTTLLIRPRSVADPGLYAYHASSATEPNIRATRFAMFCGHWAYRFHGTVVLSTNGMLLADGGATSAMRYTDTRCCFHFEEIVSVATHLCCPDLRENLQENEDSATALLVPSSDWIGNAAREQYQDTEAIQRLHQVMEPVHPDEDDEENDTENETVHESITDSNNVTFIECVTHVPVCYHCRKPASTLCRNCEGVYFCSSDCERNGWSHQCLCSLWKIYTDRRTELSTFFPKKDDGNDFWYEPLMLRDCQLSNAPYEQFLSERLCIVPGRLGSFWNTEWAGWMGGTSDGAQCIDIRQRVSFLEGFHPISDVPPEQYVSEEDHLVTMSLSKNAVGLWRLLSWSEYYRIRQISTQSSPIALLLTYPMTLYFGIVEYGSVACKVAHEMERRPLRIHIVGVEKELNFLDLFKEVSFWLPRSFHLELVFCIRPDMLPESGATLEPSSTSSSTTIYSGQLTATLRVVVVSGIYGDDIHPHWDCGSGPPDILFAYNAGLYAYDSWRPVISYLYQHGNVLGIFTDYNEHSAVQCASRIGGYGCRNSVRVNPFRQPRAMPVYSMNLPQFCNGFLYVVNQASLEE